MSDWKCCEAERPAFEKPVLIRKKHSKVLIGIFELCNTMDQYLLCTDDEVSLVHDHVVYEWKYAEDL